MLRVRTDDKNKRLSISFLCTVYKNIQLEINSRRPYDETLEKTFRKIAQRYAKHLRALLQRDKTFLENQRIKKNRDKIEYLDEAISLIVSRLNLIDSDLIQKNFSLYDSNNQPVSLEAQNYNAWKENCIFKNKEQEYKVYVNLPYIKKISLAKVSIAGFPTVARLLFESDEPNPELIRQKSLFKWYSSENASEEQIKLLKKYKNTRKYPQIINEIKWNLIDEGISKMKIIPSENLENRLIKIECYPRDNTREGFFVQTVSDDKVLEKLDKEKMPMTDRHQLTKYYLNSNFLRVMSYNILAYCYTDSLVDNEYKYCDFKYLNFDYRRPLLLHEISNYNCDVIFLQECNSEFVFNDLNVCMPHYECLFNEKSGLTAEGEAILIRSDKLRLVKSYEINFAQEFKSNKAFKEMRHKFSKTKKLLINEKGNILQVALVEFVEIPGNYLIVANTHLYFHPTGDFVRLIQTIISLQFLQDLKLSLYRDKYVKKVNILFAGDFNSTPNSCSIKYILNEKVNLETLKTDEKISLEDYDLSHSLKLTTFSENKPTSFGKEFEGVLDYIFYENEILQLTREIPFPPIEKIREFVSIPNKYVPSDHLALIYEYFLKI
ncbi:unnamed protein product [Brachionus calyciflorus]|uniref:Endonuclease/exonuclease/phosphatase domain-containing protein n=1 Tax=Brachionus calyciflorus TaxID=104777 RepID=A0A813QHC1_9BILA|nr:unnamed protein product [Brachionus calyciflorus]